ncbi:hypothetical protein Goarm_022149, partial [Gossypium armourianum]|nr:hypothetical protein [Gossypium armourianum]
MSITGMSEQWVAAWIKQKGDSKCIPWKSLKDAILTNPDVRKRVDVFALSIYGLVVFPKALRHVDEAVTDLFDWLDGIFKRRTSSGEPLGCFQVRYYIRVVVSIGFLCWEFGELLDMPH